jgi:aminomethyltransferase
VVWDRLLRVGASLGVSPVGAGALDIVRIEGGVPLAGVDWQPVQLARSDQDIRVPADLGFAPAASRRFNGSWALGRTSSTYKLVQLSSTTPMLAGAVTARGAAAGTITSVAWSASRNRCFAIGWIAAEHCVPGTLVQGTGRTGPVAWQVVRTCFL